MKSTASIATRCLSAAAGLGCAAVMVLRPPGFELPAPPGTGYLDCARILSERLAEPDLLTLCSVLASGMPRSAV